MSDWGIARQLAVSDWGIGVSKTTLHQIKIYDENAADEDNALVATGDDTLLAQS